MVEIRRYTTDDKALWDDFIEGSKNGNFLMKRDYMDYHADRFTDHSLLFFTEGGLYAVLPANISGDTLYSHQGLTYGGLVMGTRCTAPAVAALFEDMNRFLKEEGVKKVVYKAVPTDYHRYPAQEDLYALFNRCGARLSQRNLSSVVDLRCPLKWNRDRRYGANKAARDGITVAESHDYAGFWKILEGNLHDRYGALPVHSLLEIELLAGRFPDNIRLVTATLDGGIIGGTVLYLMPPVAHAQYISASREGKKLHAIDAIFRSVLDHCEDFDYFDFGTSNEDHGLTLNESLIYQKEGFGGRGICYDIYEYTLS